MQTSPINLPLQFLNLWLTLLLIWLIANGTLATDTVLTGVVITAAMPDGTGIDRFAARYPRRAYDAGIAEQHAVTFAAGLAAEGMRPVCAIYSSFLQRAFDQIVHDVALQELPVTFAMDWKLNP